MNRNGARRVQSVMASLILVQAASMAIEPTTLLADDALVPSKVRPVVYVRNIRRVFHNGEHNAFTDLVHFQDRLYLTFRSCPDGHMVFGTASIIVLASTDMGATWSQVHRFRVKDRDTRDPHFLVFRNRLFVYTGTWYSGPGELPRNDYDLNLHLGYAVWSENGVDWSEPRQLEGTFGHYIWRATAFDGTAYLCGRRKIGFNVAPRGEGRAVESAMLESDDGLVWRTRAFFQKEQGDETAFLFEPQGDLLFVSRRGRASALLGRSQPPYDDVTHVDLGEYIGGPLLVKWGDRYIVGGRNHSEEQGYRTRLSWLSGDRLEPFATLPSGGDNSYPGFVALSPSSALVSWYSSHERNDLDKSITAIYLAELELEE